MTHCLDNPVWSALTTRHSHLAEGGPSALRYQPAVAPFVVPADERQESWSALAALLSPSGSGVVVRAGPIEPPGGLAVVSRADVVQMIAYGPPPEVHAAGIEPLQPDDAAEMMELATLTKPGPFSRGALALGSFWGIRIAGRLAAMAGERMKQPGHTEVSGVCTHPDFRGRGFARTLSAFAARHIAARGETPYLHAYASNGPAIALYESLGFTLRSAMTVAVLAPAPARDADEAADDASSSTHFPSIAGASGSRRVPSRPSAG